ncbi:PH domain-containing protein [Streptomyces caniscabiei]|uniref:PH domain-containing protein n=1 Tax=Streptomyces caniscabiei TaxID=2746961 RepID=UPI0029B85ED4|nr:PH domain-containing protein [Streptomyces caniscabiei]MDX2776556.1 PH domain-containing protein [Streptomyces caniscabiei]
MNEQPRGPQQPNQSPLPEQPQPVAYDTQGRPLYHAPPQQYMTPAQQYQQPVQPQQPNYPPPQGANTPQAQAQQPAPQFVHLSRAIEPVEQPVSPEIKRRHDESAKAFPQLNLSNAEFVINMVQRHPIGLVVPVGLGIFLVALIASVMVNFELIMNSVVGPNMFPVQDVGSVYLIGFLMILLVGALTYIHTWIYLNNKFFLTNESVIQEIQVSLFSRHEQTVSLANIEDASYRQQGILQTMFNYGSIRLSTEGDETTYRFNYVADPKRHIAILNDAVEAFKNGRPVLND